MRYLRCAAAVIVTLLASAGVAAAQGPVATQTVAFEIQPINEISVSGDPGALIINSATAGGDPVSVSDNTTTYSITTNETGKRISVTIDADMPAGVTLEVNMVEPTGATSTGNVVLSTTAVDAVTGISNVAETGLAITYTLSATAAAAVTAESRTVTLTIM